MTGKTKEIQTPEERPWQPTTKRHKLQLAFTLTKNRALAWQVIPRDCYFCLEFSINCDRQRKNSFPVLWLSHAITIKCSLKPSLRNCNGRLMQWQWGTGGTNIPRSAAMRGAGSTGAGKEVPGAMRKLDVGKQPKWCPGSKCILLVSCDR